MTDPRLAVMTFSILRAPYGDALVQRFDDATPGIYLEAEGAPGFIDRAVPVDDVPWMTNFQKDWGEWGPFAVPRFYLGGVTPGHTSQAQTLSLWTDLGSLARFVFRGALHRDALKRRGEWFGPQGWPIYCLWWAHRHPTWREACLRLEHLHDHGSTAACFTFTEPFDAQGRPARTLQPPAEPAEPAEPASDAKRAGNGSVDGVAA
ncbi:MAG TPA: DUF3291 domain-containing protein [Allosphingosinicella sp.]